MDYEAEERAGKAVCVIGETVRRKPSGAQNPIDSEIRIKQFACEVIGSSQKRFTGH